MTALTPDAILQGTVYLQRHLGDQIRVFPFTGVESGDTWISGISDITGVAWEATASGDEAQVGESATNGTLVWLGITGTGAGNLIIWSGADR